MREVGFLVEEPKADRMAYAPIRVPAFCALSSANRRGIAALDWCKADLSKWARMNPK